MRVYAPGTPFFWKLTSVAFLHSFLLSGSRVSARHGFHLKFFNDADISTWKPCFSEPCGPQLAEESAPDGLNVTRHGVGVTMLLSVNHVLNEDTLLRS